MNNRCPIQIVDEPRRNSQARWITLLKNIDFEKGVYHNIIHFYKGTRIGAFNSLWIRHLFNGHQAAPIDPQDIIRNPTIEEWKIIGHILKQHGYKINLKTQELIYPTNVV